MKRVTEKSHELNRDVHMIIVHFKAAYGSVSKEKLWDVMGRMGVPAKPVRMVNIYARGSKSRFDGELSNLPVMTGLRQGDVPSPALFNVTLKSVMIKVLIQAKGINIKNNR